MFCCQQCIYILMISNVDMDRCIYMCMTYDVKIKKS